MKRNKKDRKRKQERERKRERETNGKDAKVKREVKELDELKLKIVLH